VFISTAKTLLPVHDEILMANWQIGKMANWQNGKLAKWEYSLDMHAAWRKST
jgi:hypothetical protein